MPSDTPLTDSQLLSLDCDDSCVEIYVKRDGVTVNCDIVSAEFARELERKIARLEREIADMGRGD